MDDERREYGDQRTEHIGIAAERDYYTVLGVTPEASPDEIRRAFRELAKRWHPDLYVNATPTERGRAERHMREVLEAHEALGDPNRRAIYDLHRVTLPEHRAIRRNAAYTTTVPIHGMYPTTDAPGANANPNTNGAGQVFGTLFIGVALAIVARSLIRGGTQSAVAGIVEFVVVAGLFVFAAFCYMEGSVIARAATRLMEGEPRVRRSNQRQPPVPHRRVHAEPEMPVSEFERYVDEALSTIPDEFRDQLENVVVRVEDEPTERELRDADVPEGYTLLGLYHGVPLTQHGIHTIQPEIVSIYRGPIERHCHHDPERIREQVRATTLHEIAHHFGIDHDHMPAWVKA
ncbi:MAG: metallopeptidase family protein [Ktedonobacterales bacterium]